MNQPAPDKAAALARLQRNRARLEQVREAWPLAFAVLWEPECKVCRDPTRPGDYHRGPTMRQVDGALHECPVCGRREQRTNQRAAAQAFLSGDSLEWFLLGGSRTGKTEEGGQLATAFALGRDHDAVQRWAKLNRLDIHRIQPGPGRVWAISQTFNNALEYLRPKLDKYLPAGTVRRNWTGEGEATATLPGGGVIVSKAVLQAQANKGGKNPFEGAAIHFGWFDEEPPVKLAVQSTLMRLTDHKGPMLFTMTPLSGWTAFLLEKLSWKKDGKPPPEGLVLRALTGTDNPHIDPTDLLRRLATLPPTVREARLKGEITVLEGAVHGDFSRDRHVVPAFDPPPHWPRYGDIDFGVRAPFCYHWSAHDRDNGVLHVYRERYQAECSTRQHAAAIFDAEVCPVCRPADELGSEGWWQWRIRAVEGLSRGPDGKPCADCQGTGRREPEPVVRWADPEGLDSRKTLEECGIETKAAVKARRESYLALCERLALDAEGRPGILIHDCCHNTIRELENLVWDEARKDPRDQLPVKGDDHAWDGLRYLCYNHKLLSTGGGGMVAVDTKARSKPDETPEDEPPSTPNVERRLPGLRGRRQRQRLITIGDDE